jgi:hypothetical protein
LPLLPHQTRDGRVASHPLQVEHLINRLGSWTAARRLLTRTHGGVRFNPLPAGLHGASLRFVL